MFRQVQEEAAAHPEGGGELGGESFMLTSIKRGFGFLVPDVLWLLERGKVGPCFRVSCCRVG